MRNKMINLINKLLAKFQLKLVSTKSYSLVEEGLKYLNSVPKSYLNDDIFLTLDVGDITYLTDKNGKTYFRGGNNYCCDYEGDENVTFKEMYKATVFTAKELQEKLKENN